MSVKSKIAFQLIDKFCLCPDEKNMSELVYHAYKNDLMDSEILYLADKLADSGIRINQEKRITACDIPSTGGPSSLSTLLCPLFLKILGNHVIKLGIPGRPAGGIDVLAQIPDYQINPEPNQLYEWLNISSYVHFICNNYYTPLDSKLFQYRKKTNMLDIPSLVIASLLSKKIAVGLDYVGLDIRVSSFGNFGKTWSEAREYGRRFNKIALVAGIQSKCFLTNGNIPQQPYIGRGEAILALKSIFSNRVDEYLANHLDQCFFMANSVSHNKAPNGYNVESLKIAFEENVKIQGGLISSIEIISEEVCRNHRYHIKANEDGFLTIDMGKIRNAILTVQSKSSDLFPDNCGIIMKVMPNTFSNKGEILCTFRCEEQYKELFEKYLTSSFGSQSRLLVIENSLEEIA